MIRCFAWLLLPVVASATPTGLLTNLLHSPALGVPAEPRFSWIVPAAPAETEHAQTAYRLKVVHEASGTVTWDSGTVSSNRSTSVTYGGPALSPGAGYTWTVTTTTSGQLQASAPHVSTSAPATFVTALFDGFAANASFIWSKSSKGSFAFARKVVKLPSTPQRATAYVSALTDDYVLCGFKLYIGGVLVGVGPGRGEAPVLGGNGTFMARPYVALDATAAVGAALSAHHGEVVVALQSLGSVGTHGHNKGRGVLLQLEMSFGESHAMRLVTDATWQAFDADTYLHPKIGGGTFAKNLEFTDARLSLHPASFRG
jgi:hypothetical protein